MYRSLILCLALAGPALAQRGDEWPAMTPPLAARPAVPPTRVESLATEIRTFGPRVDVGLVVPRPPDESQIDMEAVLRQYLPDEETLRRDERRLEPTIRRMQGLWRVQKM